MLVITALGGNALLKRGQALTARQQWQNVQQAAKSLAELIRAGHQLVITHGNGPQVGLLAMQDAANSESSFPLDVLGAETEGMIGYMIEQALENELGDQYEVASLLTQVRVDSNDSAFDKPTKFVGATYAKDEAEQLADKYGWQIARDGDDWRRVVASPEPVEIIDIKVMQILLKHAVHLICTGGGGIPVVKQEDESLCGIEAVIDKDKASALLGQKLQADALLLLTDVDAVYLNFDSDHAEAVSHLTVEQARDFDAPEGSMKPKLCAASAFAKSGGIAAIGKLEDAMKLLTGEAGTHISH